MKQTLPSGVRLDEGRGGLSRLVVATDVCSAELYLLGAHLCHWQPRDHPHPVLWMSQQSRFEMGVPIRGGVPICFPWFGGKGDNPAAPGHGVARIKPWTLDGASAEPDGTIVVQLSLVSDAGTRTFVPQDFALVHTLRLGRALSMALTVTNPGQAPFTFEEALHTYFTVGDVRNVKVAGLSGVTYVDKTDNARRTIQTEEFVTVSRETDRLYLNTPATITVTDPVLGRSISIAKRGSEASVVWNPWIAKSRAMPDFGDDEWPGMICIETVNAADNVVTLPSHGSYTMSAKVDVAFAR